MIVLWTPGISKRNIKMNIPATISIVMEKGTDLGGYCLTAADHMSRAFYRTTYIETMAHTLMDMQPSLRCGRAAGSTA